ncbi:hypothetical protein FRC01_013538 [Tulasnella sp. 417]|nr:hypothetical protein FRC01_013538 [Tulasnella sp. 417]
MWLSPEDAAAGAWASTILTAALVIPALYSKMQRELTLHHATLVLNFCTLSTIVSVAAAPMVPIWRIPRRRRGSDVAAFQQEQDERARGRIILSLALLAQIVLQWIWTVFMFVYPVYAQKRCSPDTIIIYLAGSHRAEYIKNHFASWAAWLFLCICSSLIFGVVMVFSCPSPVHETPLNYDHIESNNSTVKGKILRWLQCIKHFLYPKDDDLIWERWWIRISQLFAFAIVAGFFVLSEVQISTNSINRFLLSGENDIWSFSQSAAVFLALSPIWPIGIAWLRKHNNPFLPVHHWNYYYDPSISRHAHSLRSAPSFPNTPTPVPDPLSPGQLSSPPPSSFGVMGGNIRNVTYDPYDPTGQHVSYTDPFTGHPSSLSTYHGPPSPQLPGGEQVYMPVPTFAFDAASDGEGSESGSTIVPSPRSEYDRPQPGSPPSPSPPSAWQHERRPSLPPSSPARRPTGPRTPIQRNRSGSSLSSLGEELGVQPDRSSRWEALAVEAQPAEFRCAEVEAPE